MSLIKDAIKASSVSCMLAFTALTSTIITPPSQAFAQAAQHDAMITIQTAANNFLNAYKRNPRGLYSQLNTHILPHLDFPSLARNALGPEWRSASNAQRNQFTEEFAKLLAKKIGSELAKLTNKNIEYERVRTIRGGNSPRVSVETEMTNNNGNKISVDYSMYRTRSGRWKVYAIQFEGFSLARSYRREFQEIIDNKGGMDGLIQELKRRNARSGPIPITLSP